MSPGDVVVGRFEIVNELGRGGYAIVYRARDLQNDEMVALKTIRPVAPRPKEVVARFRREVELLSMLKHPNTVQVYDYGVETDLYLAMELLDGHPLADELDGATGMPVHRAALVAQGVLASLTEAHDLSIVHRDLKPENIFIIADAKGTQQIKVLDFGIAKFTNPEMQRDANPSLTLVGRAMGTPTYMSPEQARGSDLTTRSDIYAVGVLMYELLCGVPPFTGSNAMEIMLKHVNAPIPRLTVAHLRGTPIELAIRKALAKKPANRFANAHIFLAAIGGTAVTRVGAKPQPPPLPTPARPHLRSRERTLPASPAGPLQSTPAPPRPPAPPGPPPKP